MTLAVQTNRELLAPWTETQFISYLMAALKSSGFSDPPYDYHPAKEATLAPLKVTDAALRSISGSTSSTTATLVGQIFPVLSIGSKKS